MPQAAEAAVRRAKLPADGPLLRILLLLRMAEETHLDAAEAQRIAAEVGRVPSRCEAIRRRAVYG